MLTLASPDFAAETTPIAQANTTHGNIMLASVQ